jgi:hypothetical protein
MEWIQFFKFWIWQEFFRLIISYLPQKPGTTDAVNVLILFENLPTGSLPSFFEVFCRRWLIVEFSTLVKFLRTNCRPVKKRCKNPKSVAVQFAKWWHCTYCSTVRALWQGSENAYFCITYINCATKYRWKKSTKVMTQFAKKWCHWMLQWYCLLNNVMCSATIDCCSTFRHKLLGTERSVTSNTATIEELDICHSSGSSLHRAQSNIVRICT